MSKEWKHVLVIYRFDEFLYTDGRKDINSLITVKSVYDGSRISESQVISEVDRLNVLNKDKGVKYYWDVSKFYENI